MIEAMREILGEAVREYWIEWAKTQPDPKPSWLVPWAELDEASKEADRHIGQKMYELTWAYQARRIMDGEFVVNFKYLGRGMFQVEHAFWADQIKFKIGKEQDYPEGIIVAKVGETYPVKLELTFIHRVLADVSAQLYALVEKEKPNVIPAPDYPTANDEGVSDGDGGEPSAPDGGGTPE